MTQKTNKKKCCFFKCYQLVSRDEFPTLSLEQVYGAITFYLAHRAEVDRYLKESEAVWEEARKGQPPLPTALRERLERVRRELTSPA